MTFILTISLFILLFAEQERRIREMLSIVDGGTDDLKNPSKGNEQPAPVVAKARYV